MRRRTLVVLWHWRTVLCISLAQDYQQTLSHKEPLIKKQIKDRLLNLCWGEGVEEEHPKEKLISRSEVLL